MEPEIFLNMKNKDSLGVTEYETTMNALQLISYVLW